MKKIFKANLYFLIILILEVIAPINLSLIYKKIGLNDVRIILLINHVVIFLLPAVIYIILSKSSFKKQLRLNKIYAPDLFLIILLGFLVQPIMILFSLLATFFFNNNIAQLINEMNSTPYVVMLMLIGLLPAITEEVTIRGIVLSGYEDKNIYKAAIVTGIFFGILHLDGHQFLYATALGFIFAIVVRITNSIFSAAIMHFIINGTSVTLFKISTLIQSNKQFVEQSTKIDINQLPLITKITMVSIASIIAFGFGIIVFLIIKKLERLNIKRGNLKISDIKGSKSKERIINIPFILIIILYSVIMWLTLRG